MTMSVSFQVDRAKALPFLAVSMGLLAFSIWAIMTAPTTTFIRSETFARVIGVLAFAGGVYGTVRSGFPLFASPALALSAEGLAIRIAGPPTRLLLWNEVAGVTYSSQHTFVHLIPGKRLRLNPWVKDLTGSLPSQALAEAITEFGASIGWQQADGAGSGS